MKINKHEYTSMNINANQQKPIEIMENQRKSRNINKTQSKSMNIIWSACLLTDCLRERRGKFRNKNENHETLVLKGRTLFKNIYRTIGRSSFLIQKTCVSS